MRITVLAGTSIRALLLILVCAAGRAQTPGGTQNAPGSAGTGAAEESRAGYYATLNRRLLEANVQFELLTQLSQLHRKRADEAPRDQAARSQWENDLAKELSDQASATAGALESISKERAAFEKDNPVLAGSQVAGVLSGTTNGPSLDEISFLVKLEQRRAAVQQEIATAIETGNLYSAQLLTNKGTYEFSRISSLIQDNGYTLKLLQRELSDLELRNLEFRALRRR